MIEDIGFDRIASRIAQKVPDHHFGFTFRQGDRFRIGIAIAGGGDGLPESDPILSVCYPPIAHILYGIITEGRVTRGIRPREDSDADLYEGSTRMRLIITQRPKGFNGA